MDVLDLQYPAESFDIVVDKGEWASAAQWHGISDYRDNGVCAHQFVAHAYRPYSLQRNVDDER